VNKETATQVGFAISLLGQRFPTTSIPTRWFYHAILPAISHRQICFAFDEGGAPLAFWTWAFLEPATAKSMLQLPETSLHIAEWGEGTDLWLIDFVAPRGRVGDLAWHMKASFEPDFASAYSFRRWPDGRLRRINQHDLAGAGARVRAKGHTGITLGTSGPPDD